MISVIMMCTIKEISGGVMNRKIRKGVFETNSSSVHSLVISNEGREPSEFKLNKDGEIEIDFGQFGKDKRIYTSQYDKLSYLITCLYYLSGWEISDIYDRREFREIQEAICKYTGATGIKIIGEQEPEIDHQSQPYDGIEIINVYDDDKVINFVFNKYVLLKTDCD